MKKIMVILLLIMVIIFVEVKDIEAKGNTTENKSDAVYIQQIEEKNKLLIQALDSLGAKSKDEVVYIYAQGVKNRSGPLQYAVMCKELKKDFVKTMEKDKNYAWVTGFSSPWISNYEIIYNKQNKDKSYTVTIKFSWETSSGPYNSSETNINIKEQNGIWCITSIENEY
ncbi:hypothetical protein [Romboutsia sp.]|uniref:hypothetical protein n=1 Tax=Romboutsia sp. TaxID=1965302 RepID=UPI003F396809